MVARSCSARISDTPMARKTPRPGASKKTGWNTYIGTREDVVGNAKVTLAGDKAYFNYTVDLAPGDGRNLVRFYDTLELSADGRSVVNTARVFKGPFPIARVRVDFRR
jgi:hypothetical protein